jgi:hypothetical protein
MKQLADPWLVAQMLIRVKYLTAFSTISANHNSDVFINDYVNRCYGYYGYYQPSFHCYPIYYSYEAT